LKNPDADRLREPADNGQTPAIDAWSPAQDPAAVRREMNALVGMLSHDLRTPLSAISGWLHLLETGKLDAAGQQRALARIRSNIDGQVLVLDDAVLLARARSGCLEITLATIAVADALGAALDAVAPLAAQRAVTVRTSGANETAARVTADGPLLHRALLLILQQAVEATPNAGTVEVDVRTAGSQVCIAIAAQGNGKTKEELDALNSALRSDGSAFADGLPRVSRSLLLAQSLVAVHHGYIAADSRGHDHGTSITVYLPLETQ
jgi:signal transduction histidine kinase